jgi:hypothetical protein
LVHSEKAERFSFEYDQQRTPPAIGKPLQVDIAVRSAADQEAFDPKGLEEKFETVAGVDRSVRRRPRPAGHPA